MPAYHARHAVRLSIVSALEGAGAVFSSNVFTLRAAALTSQDMPAAVVWLDSEDTQFSDKGVNTAAGRTVVRALDVKVQLFAVADDTDALVVIEQGCAEVEAAMATLTGVVWNDSTSPDTKLDEISNADRQYLAATLSYPAARYRTGEFDPTVRIA